jgi:hypothetical protein
MFSIIATLAINKSKSAIGAPFFLLCFYLTKFLYKKMKPFDLKAWQLSTENFKGSNTQIATDKIQFDSKFNGYEYQKEPTGIYLCAVNS